MPENWFSLTRIFPYKDKTFDYVLIRENIDQRKVASWQFYAVKGICPHWNIKSTMQAFLCFVIYIRIYIFFKTRGIFSLNVTSTGSINSLKKHV